MKGADRWWNHLSENWEKGSGEAVNYYTLVTFFSTGKQNGLMFLTLQHSYGRAGINDHKRCSWEI